MIILSKNMFNYNFGLSVLSFLRFWSPILNTMILILFFLLDFDPFSKTINTIFFKNIKIEVFEMEGSKLKKKK